MTSTVLNKKNTSISLFVSDRTITLNNKMETFYLLNKDFKKYLADKQVIGNKYLISIVFFTFKQKRLP